MNRARLWRALIALLVVGITGFFAVTKDPNLGLDLRGGSQVVLETKDSPTTVADAEATDRALEVLRRRVDALGVSEPTLARSGDNRIIIELPGYDDPEEAERAVGRTAQLTFHAVLGPGDPSAIPGADPAPTAEPTAEPDTAGEVEPAAEPTAEAGEAAPDASPVPEPSPTTQPGDVGDGVSPEQFDPSQQQSILDDSESPIEIGPAAITGDGVGDATAEQDPTTGIGNTVSVDFRGGGGRQWEALTGAAACNAPGDPQRRVAIVLDGEVISSPQVDPGIQCGIGIQGGRTSITGNFTREEATDLAVLIKGGALPVPVETISRSFVGPTLGQDAIDASFRAAIIGFILSAIFFTVVYRLVGFLAVLALASFGVIAYGSLVAIGATLTLPGLAGLLLSAGLAIDANVLVFERAREEFHAQRKPRLISALDRGFAKALSAITDSNITTVLAAGLLFLLASGPVRGFGVTLTIGVAASIVSALLVTRVLTDFAVQRKAFAKRPRWTGIGAIGRFRAWVETSGPDIMKRSTLWFAVSGAALVLAFGGMLVRGFNFGVEFTGGRVVEYSASERISVTDAREAVSEAGFPTAVVQETGTASGDPNISVRLASREDEDERTIRAALGEIGGTVAPENDQIIGPTLGSELRTRALIALVVALAAQLVYLAVRFRWTFATAAVIAIFHDVLIVLGVFVWLGKPIDGIFLASALTIIGVSVNDTIITLDRIRERWAANRTKPLAGIVNTAVLQVAPRTINTSISTVFILGALLLLGGASLADFSLALLLGLIVGTYSSAFFVCPLVIALEKRNPKPPPMPKRADGYNRGGSKGPKKGPQPIFQTRGGGAVR
jgi:SecD/SecF fusion protein